MEAFPTHRDDEKQPFDQYRNLLIGFLDHPACEAIENACDEMEPKIYDAYITEQINMHQRFSLLGLIAIIRRGNCGR